MRPSRWSARIGGTVILLVGLLGTSQAAQAQTPQPGNFFEDWRPTNVQYTTNGIIIEGLGSFCNSNYSLSKIETATVSSINSGHATITELTPQSACGSQQDYITLIHSLIGYVVSNTTSSATLWGGIMFDLEPVFDDTTVDSTLEGYTATQMQNVGGIPWFYPEIGPSNGGVTYSQATYNGLTNVKNSAGQTYDGRPAPQVYNSNFRDFANNLGESYQMVTWWSGSSSPYNSASYAAGSINGAPYNEQFGTSHAFQWENTYQNQ